jgi:hypothetical protein
MNQAPLRAVAVTICLFLLSNQRLMRPEYSMGESEPLSAHQHYAGQHGYRARSSSRTDLLV